MLRQLINYFFESLMMFNSRLELQISSAIRSCPPRKVGPRCDRQMNSAGQWPKINLRVEGFQASLPSIRNENKKKIAPFAIFCCLTSLGTRNFRKSPVKILNRMTPFLCLDSGPDTFWVLESLRGFRGWKANLGIERRNIQRPVWRRCRKQIKKR